MSDASSKLVPLLQRVAGGDRSAFRNLYDATSAKLFGTIFRILRRRELAEEVLQETYVTIWERAGDFEPGRASPITWMTTIARNRALDEVRRKRPQATDDETAILNVADPAPAASDMLVAGEELQRLQRCIEALGNEKGAMVRLAYLDGWSREQLAERYGAPVPTIKTWLHRSLKQLKDCLGS